MIKISVIICTYNRYESLKNTLNSLLSQECDKGFDYEVIVVDNNSEDKTKETVESYIPKFNGKLRYLFEPRQGKSYALNTGIKESKGEIISFTDDDVLPDKCWLSNLHQTFKETNAVCIGGNVKPKWNCQKPKWLEVKGLFSLQGPLCINDRGNEISDNINPVGCNMAIRKDIFDKYGGFRTDLQRVGNGLISGEDTVFCQGLRNEGEKIVYNPNALVYHVISQERVKKSYFRRWYFAKGRSESRIMLSKEENIIYLWRIPRYFYKLFLKYLLKWILFSIRRDTVKTFYYEMQMQIILGFVTERWFYNRLSL